MRVLLVVMLALAADVAHANPKVVPGASKAFEDMADVVVDLSRAVMNLGAGPYSRALIFEPPADYADARPYGQGGMVMKPPDVDRDMVMGRVTIASVVGELLGKLVQPWLWKSS